MSSRIAYSHLKWAHPIVEITIFYERFFFLKNYYLHSTFNRVFFVLFRFLGRYEVKFFELFQQYWYNNNDSNRVSSNELSNTIKIAKQSNIIIEELPNIRKVSLL